jgi:hypothetical protein
MRDILAIIVLVWRFIWIIPCLLVIWMIVSITYGFVAAAESVIDFIDNLP